METENPVVKSLFAVRKIGDYWALYFKGQIFRDRSFYTRHAALQYKVLAEHEYNNASGQYRSSKIFAE